MVVRHGVPIVPVRAGSFPGHLMGGARRRRVGPVYPRPVLRRLLLALARRASLLAACMQEAEDPRPTAARRRLRRPRPAPRAAPSPRSRSSGTTAVAVECATLEVPLDYDDPDGEQIELVRGPHAGQRRSEGCAVRQPGRTRCGARPSTPSCCRTSFPRRSPSTSTSSASIREAWAAAPRSAAGSPMRSCTAWTRPSRTPRTRRPTWR